MALVARTPPSETSSLGLFAATCIPLAYGLLCAAPFPELGGALPLLIGSAADSGSALSEPATLLARLCTLVPLGPLALRIALASALAGAFCMRLLYRSIDTLLRAQGVSHDALIAPVALGLCLFVFGMPALLEPACRPGAFALQGALALVVLSRLSTLEAAWPSHDLRPLYGAALALGLCCANDLRSGLLLLPAALPTLSRVLHAKGPAPLLRSAGFALAAGIGVQAVFIGRHELQPFSVPLAQLASSTVSTGPAPLILLARFTHELGLFALLAGLGAVAALQTPGVRRLAVLWIGACLPPVAAYGILARAPEASEGLGMIAYVLPASAVLAAALPGALLAPDGRSKAQPSRAQRGAVLCLLLLGALRAQQSAIHDRDASLALVDTLSGLGRHLLPTNALVLVRDPNTALPLLASEAEDRVRPDLHILPMALLDHPRSARALLEQQPQLRPLLRSYLLNGELSTPDLESLSARQALLLDMDPSIEPELYGILRPRHMFYEVAGSGGMQAEERAAGAGYRAALGTLQLEAAQRAESDPAKRMLALHALAGALYFAGAGDRENAHFAIDQGRALAPALPLWDAVSTSLGPESARGPADVHSWVPERAADIVFTAP